jgi:hypothetical protein
MKTPCIHALLFLPVLGCLSSPDNDDTGTDTAPPGAEVTLEDVASEGSDGVSILDGRTVTTTGVATVAAGVLSGRKLRIHIQDGPFGCAVDADEVVAAELASALGGIIEGDELTITGLVTQEDLPSNDEAGAQDGLTRVRIEDATLVERLSSGNDLPDPQLLTIDEILAAGDTWEGILVRVEAVHKHADHATTWVSSLDSSTMIDVHNDDDAGPMKVRLGNGERTGGYGDDPGTDPFDLVGLLREDWTLAPETDPSGTSFEIWPRGERDILR